MFLTARTRHRNQEKAMQCDSRHKSLTVISDQCMMLHTKIRDKKELNIVRMTTLYPNNMYPIGEKKRKEKKRLAVFESAARKD